MMKRTCALTLLVFASSMAGYSSERPNILFIHMEDMGQQIAAYGDRTAHTPQLDRLAAEGMVFERACVTAATCASSRGSLFSGLYPHQNGIMGFVDQYGFHYRDGIPTFVQMLSKAGYYTGLTYKTGVDPWEAVPFHQHDNWRKNRLHPEDNRNEIKNAIDNFRWFLQNRPKDRPFYFQAQTVDTHTDWVGEKRFSVCHIDGLPGAEIYRAVDLETVQPLPHFGPDFKMTSEVRAFMSGYYEAIQRADYFAGQVLALLEEFGEEGNTLVIFSADHGPSHLSRGKTTSYEFGLRVPFIVRWPGYAAAGSRSEALVSFVDLMPTFLDIAGVDAPAYLPGLSLLPVFRGEKPQGVRAYQYSAYNTHTTAYYLYWPTRTICDGRYKLIFNVLGNGWRNRETWLGFDPDPEVMADSVDSVIRKALLASGETSSRAFARGMTPPEIELYDLRDDPGELINLAGSPEYSRVEAMLKTELLRWRRDGVNDPFLDPDYVQAFSADYAAKAAFFWKHGKDRKVEEGMSRIDRWNKWKLDMDRWIPAWDCSGYNQDPAR